MMMLILVNWIVGKEIARNTDRNPKYKRMILLAGIVFDLVALGFFKYAAFGVRIVNVLIGREMAMLPQIRLPIGMEQVSVLLYGAFIMESWRLQREWELA